MRASSGNSTLRPAAVSGELLSRNRRAESSPKLRSTDRALLVIGFGSSLRGDDAVGPRLAESVSRWRLNGVRCLSLPQLAPELAEEIALSSGVLFIDACDHQLTPGIALTPIEPLAAEPRQLHRWATARLLALTESVFGVRVRGWMLTIPATSFDLGAPLSLSARRHLRLAKLLLRDWIEEQGALRLASSNSVTSVRQSGSSTGSVWKGRAGASNRKFLQASSRAPRKIR